MSRLRYFPQSAAPRRWLTLATALGALLAAAIVATLVIVPGIASGDEGQPKTIRQVFISTASSKLGLQVHLADTYTLVGEDGAPEAFIGRYYDPEGRLMQAQYRTSSGETVYWASYQGEGFACVEEIPPAPHGLEGLLPARFDSEGYQHADEPGPVPEVSSIPPAPATPSVSRPVDLASATIWLGVVEGDDGVTRERRYAVSPDGLIVGFWSVTRDGDGNIIGRNSHIDLLYEEYDSGVFAEELAILQPGLEGIKPCH